LRQAALEPQALERGRHIVAAQAATDVDRQAFAREEIDDGQRTKAPTIGQLIGDEVHAPDVVAGRRGSSLLPVHRRRVAPRTFPPEGQAFLGVHPIKALFSDLPAFPEEQDPQPAVPKPDPRLGELAHALPQRRQRILPAAVVHRRSCRPDHAAGPPGAHRVSAHQVPHHLAPLDGLQNFF
jgi:predicted transcriptional regulator